MTYAYDDYVQMPTKDLYDTAVMKMAIEAAKDMYDKGQAQMENFYKTYGDFMSPFAADMQKYGAAMDYVRKTVNDAYARGIDLFKSPEGRAIVAQLSHSIDPLWYNSARQNAKVGYSYLEAAQKLAQQGKYSEAQEMFDILQSGGTKFGDFSTVDPNTGKIRMWQRTSPVEATSFQELVHPSFANIKPHLLSKEEAISKVGSEYDPTYEYTGVTKADMERAMRDALPGLMGMPGYNYYKELAKQQLIASGVVNPTDAQINEQFVQNAVTADSQMMTPLSRDRKDYYNDQMLELKRKQLDLKEHEIAIKEQIEENKKNTQGSGWTYRQRVGVMDNGKAYKDYSKKLETVKKGSTKSGAKQQLIAEGIKNPTEAQISARMDKNKQALGIYGMGDDSRSLVAMNYRAHQTAVEGNDRNTAIALAAGLNPAEPIGDINSAKRRPVSFAPDGSLNFTKARQITYAGLQYTKGSQSAKLQDYMERNGVSGHLVNTDHISVNHLQYGQNEGLWDINTTVRVKYSDLEGFKGNLDSVLKQIGATIKDQYDKTYDSENNKNIYAIKKWVYIPVSRTIDSKAFNDSQIDMYHDSHSLTKSLAGKRQVGYEDSDIDDMDI